jgi:hypothetical protein
MLAEGFAKAGHFDQADTLRALPRIGDMSTLRGAASVLGGFEVPLQSMDLAGAFFLAIAKLKELDGSMDIYECCFLTVMISRLVYNDDRSVDEMRCDLVAAAQ